MGYATYIKQVSRKLLAHRHLTVIGMSAILLGAAVMIMPAAKTSALGTDINICTVTGGYCFTSPGTYHGILTGVNGGGNGNYDQELDMDASSDCNGSVDGIGGCPFYNSSFNSEFDGDPIVTIYMDDGSDCAVDDGISQRLWIATCSANAAEYVQVPDGNNYELVNIWASNNDSNNVYYVCSAEGNNYQLDVIDSTSGHRCVWYDL